MPIENLTLGEIYLFTIRSPVQPLRVRAVFLGLASRGRGKPMAVQMRAIEVNGLRVGQRRDGAFSMREIQEITEA